ncbi:MAG: hypothetical protein QOF49_2240, partial [Chloroflexota bacterium]|nr:hypothetical protein [Chloroflexota bacterium]
MGPVSDPRAFLALDLGAATKSAALIGRIAHRWRLVGSIAMPASADTDGLAVELVRRVIAADPDLAAAIGLTDGSHSDPTATATSLPRLIGRSAPPRTMIVAGA